MRSLGSLGILIAAVSLPGAALAAVPIYQLSLAAGGCRTTLRLNGFPLLEDDESGAASMPVNVYLGGKRNQLTVSATGAGGCRLELTITAVDRASGAEKRVLRERLAGKAIDRTLRFDAGVDVLGRYRKAPAIRDQEAVRAYAVELVRRANAGDWSSWAAEWGPKIADYATAFGQPDELFAKSLEESFAAFKGKLEPVTAPELALDPILDGRLYRVRLASDRSALFVVKREDEELRLPVIVGMVDGKLRVVR